MRKALISCVTILGVLGVLMLHAATEPQGGATQPPASKQPPAPKRPPAVAPAQPPPEFTATGFADLATRVEQLQKEQAKFVQQQKGQTVQLSDCAKVDFKTVQSGAPEPISCPDNKVIQSIFVGPRSSGVAAFRLELGLVCCAVTLKTAPVPPTK